MKHFLPILLAAFFLPLCASAQQPEPAAAPAEKKEQKASGNVTIDIPDDVLHGLTNSPGASPATPSQPGNAGTTTRRKTGTTAGAVKKEPVTNKGFRVQIFGDGRNQATLRSRATARANAVISRFPKYRGQVYSFSKSPNWYVRLGNFKTRDEAWSALGELRKAFPAFASEMRIVNSPISVK